MNPSAERLLIVGAGMAAGRLVERLVEHGYPGRILLAGDEPVAAYNRVLLPGLLAGTLGEDALTNRPADWFDRHRIETHLGRRVSGIDLESRCVHLEDGRQAGFDRLVLAVGARVPLPEIQGIGLDGVATLRNLADARGLLERTVTPGPVIVVGGGLLGLETAHSLLERGVSVSMVHRNPRLLNRQLDHTASAMLAHLLEQRGLTLKLGTAPAAINGQRHVCSITLDSGEALAARTVVFATGTRPDDRLAVNAGLPCDVGVIVDEGLRTAHPRVFALGECARVAGTSHSLVEPVFRQAEALARGFCGQTAAFLPPTPATRLKVSDIALFSAGDVSGHSSRDQVCIRDPRRGVYRRLIFQRRRLVGAVLLGDIAGSRRIQALIDSATPVATSAARADLAFGHGVDDFARQVAMTARTGS